MWFEIINDEIFPTKKCLEELKNNNLDFETFKNKFFKSLDGIEMNLINNKGRYPSNVILEDDEEIKKLFPYTKSGGGNKSNIREKKLKSQVPLNLNAGTFESNEGSASRFFYCAKPSRSEKDYGLSDLEDSYIAMSNQSQSELEKGNTDFKSKSGYNSIKTVKNNHPTVKSIDLMKYLVRLVTPKKGLVLDHFMGSGTTGLACLDLDMRFYGIELLEDHFKIAKTRLNSKYNESTSLF